MLGNVPRVRNLIEDDEGLVHAWSPDGFQPLHLASFFGQLATVRWLLDHGADVTAVAENLSNIEIQASEIGQSARADDLGEVSVGP